MDIPHEELLSPLPVAMDIGGLPATARTVAVFGKAKNLAKLQELEGLTDLWISGVNAAAARVVGGLQRLERLVIHDLRIPDLRPFVGLSQLRSLAIAGSTKLKSLSGVEHLTGLHSLVLFDTCSVSDLEPIAPLENLERLCLEGGFSKELRAATLAPVGRLRHLQQLRLASIRVADRSLRPLHELGALRDVFIAKTFPASEFQALAAALPNVQGQWLDSL